MNVLAGDVGGTNARFALVEVDERGLGDVGCRRTYESASFTGVEGPLVRYLEDTGARPDVVSIALACPVRDGACTVPNLGWTVDERRLRESLGPDAPPLALLNDFAAVGHAVPFLAASDFEELRAGTPLEGGVIALIGAGTGLGQALLVPTDDGPRVCPAEGGHADFAPRTELEWRLKEHLERVHGRVSTERVVSGPGLEDIYDFLVEGGEPATTLEHPPGIEAPSAHPAEGLLAYDEGERAAIIAERGMSATDPTCVHALDLFVSAYGSEVGNVALTVGATGGVYVAGGIAPKILPRLRKGDFLSAMTDKGRMSEYLERIPVRVITSTEAGLIGAAAAGMRRERG